ncbi:hypothetical protein DNTS_026744, partial [Danionella cerebrum]
NSADDSAQTESKPTHFFQREDARNEDLKMMLQGLLHVEIPPPSLSADPTETVSTGNRHWILEEIQTHSTEELILSLRNTGFCHFPSPGTTRHAERLTFSFSKLALPAQWKFEDQEVLEFRESGSKTLGVAWCSWRRKMAESSISEAQDEFLCAVCLDLLKDPVTVPCGHSFCRICISGFWDQEDQKRVSSCPQCRETFSSRPALAKNIIIAEMMEKLKKSRAQAAGAAQSPAGPGDVECDLCPGAKIKAVKSCLVCLNSYCQTHFERHQEFHPGKRHTVIEATGRLQEMICPRHEKLLEIFCRTDQCCVCYLCVVEEHKTHDTVSVGAERAEKQEQLEETQRSVRQRIQERQKELEELKEGIEAHKRSADTAVEETQSICSQLIRSIEEHCSELQQKIRDGEEASVSRAQERMKRLEQEIHDLRRRNTELEKLSLTDHHLHFLQSFQSLSDDAPGSSGSSSGALASPLTFDQVQEFVPHWRKEMDLISARVRSIDILPPQPESRQELLQCKFLLRAVQKMKDLQKKALMRTLLRNTRRTELKHIRNNLMVTALSAQRGEAPTGAENFQRITLDPNTVHRNLLLSEGNRAAERTSKPRPYPDHPERFDCYPQVLGRESLGGRSYWEVELGGAGVYISVSYKSIGRKGEETELPGASRGSRIGVYVDRGAGILSFYSVSHTMSLIHSIRTSFTEPLYPGFGFRFRWSRLKASLQTGSSFFSAEILAAIRDGDDARLSASVRLHPTIEVKKPGEHLSESCVHFCTTLLSSGRRCCIRFEDQEVLEFRERESKKFIVLFLSRNSRRKMAESSISEAQDEFLCAVCLDLLKDPVTVPCGHSFCRICISGFWDQEDQKRVSSCPQCRETFSSRPSLGKNIIIAEMMEKLKKSRAQAAGAAQSPAGPGDVECDLCPGAKIKAVKSCLVCLNSYCQTHFERHQEFNPGKRHTVIEATGRLQEMICPRHEKLLEIFCRTDQCCVCYLCVVEEHKTHDTVSVGAERAEKQEQLEETQRSVRQRIQERQKELEELKEGIEAHKRSADTAVEETQSICSQLIRSIEEHCSELQQKIRDGEEASVSRAQERMKRLEQEIHDLRRRNTELEKLSLTDHHLHFLQSFQSLSDDAPGSSGSSSGALTSPLTFDRVHEFVPHWRKEMDLISARVRSIDIVPPQPESRQELLQYFQRITLDPNTVHRYLLLSEGNRAAELTDEPRPYPDHPERFDYYPQVLGRESLGGRSYWEVELGGDGVYISVSYKSIGRKGGGVECRFGCNSESWSLFWSPESLSFWFNNKETELPGASRGSRIGVYVDRGAGILSFYSVSHTMSLIHSIRTSFTEPLYPGFRFWFRSFGSKVTLCESPE